MAKQTETKIIKETSYCKIYNKVSIEDDDYYSCIERIEVKEKKREEIRFALYKDTIKVHTTFKHSIAFFVEVNSFLLLKKLYSFFNNS